MLFYQLRYPGSNSDGFEGVCPGNPLFFFTMNIVAAELINFKESISPATVKAFHSVLLHKQSAGGCDQLSLSNVGSQCNVEKRLRRYEYIISRQNTLLAGGVRLWPITSAPHLV